jgi:hypothetical protein
MFRSVVLSALWPTSTYTSGNDPPNAEILRAAFVMNVRRPEWLEQFVGLWFQATQQKIDDCGSANLSERSVMMT